MSHPSPTDYRQGLTSTQLEQFARDGYLILPDFFTAAEADRLKARADELVAGFDLATHPRTIFKTDLMGEQTQSPAKDKNKYFLDSADQIHFFFEEHAFNSSGELIVDKSKAINKIGHYLHVLDPLYHEFTYKPEVKALAKSLSFQTPIVLQSMVICKQPQIGGKVDPHRDSTFLYTEPSTATGLWFAFEDCTKDNGCLSFVPGSHKDGVNTKRFARQVTPEHPLKPTINNPNYDPSKPPGPNNEQIELIFKGEDKKINGDASIVYPPEAYVVGEVKKGTLVLIHGDVVHASTHNHSNKSRYIYTFHMIDGHGTRYSAENWLQSKTKFPPLN